MIITMKNTETREISAKIDELHEERGEAALGRVLTLLISTNETSLEHDLAVANNQPRAPLPRDRNRTEFTQGGCRCR